MARQNKTRHKILAVDPLFGNRQVLRLVNRLMKDGKKEIALRQVYRAFDLIKQELKKEPLEVFQFALENIRPAMEVRSRRVGGAAYQVPTPIRGERKESLAIRWLVLASRGRSNKEYPTFSQKLAAEIIDAFQNKGGAIKKKEDTYRMAEANKAFSHFRW